MSTPPPEPRDDAPFREPPPRSRDEAAVRYWGAIYAYVRQAGRRDQEARDLTQGFIADVLLGRDLVSKLDEHRGQFRTLLLSAVRNYLADAYRFDHAARRHPSDARIVRDDAAADAVAAPADSGPERAFHRAWVSAAVRDAADALREECRAAGREMAWDAFDGRVLKPMLEGAEPVPYDVLVARWNLREHSQVSNAIVAARRSFAAHLLRLLGARAGASREDARTELSELLRLLEGRTP
jgi:RNA polymerase sigma-70 factor (ECF subfamily)